MVGHILWEGASELDGAPIVIIATGFGARSRNEKTGDMIQTWIMRADIDPVSATRTGQDSSVCGDCPHRPAMAGSCYVTVWQAPRSVWDAYKRGIYKRATADDARDLLAGRAVRVGSYGDPAAAPYAFWAHALERAAVWTGYTHQWRTADPRLARIAMASADTLSEARLARAAGWRTFRVRAAAEPIAEREFACPASVEAGHKTDCASCRACGGTESKARAHPVIIAHGSKARRFERWQNGAATRAA